MELVGPIFEVIKSLWGPASGYINHHRKLEANVNDLRRKVNELNDRKRSLESTTEVEVHCRKRVKKEVENWFEDVQRITIEVEKIEENCRVVSYFSRAHLGKLACRKIEEVEKIYQQGNFPQGVAIDAPPSIGVTIPVTNLEGETSVKNRIWEYLMGVEIGMIGVCGMGGIGKTTIMKHINNLVLKENDKFEKVIWVTVSKDWNIFKLQEDIAKSMKLGSFPMDELERAAILKDVLERKRFLLILDDVWSYLPLLDVGIPVPIYGKVRKVVLTSRSMDVCKALGCEVVKVEPLSAEESMNLFLDHVGRSVMEDQELEGIVKLIVGQCGGLPLAIITIACSMKGEDKIFEWSNALNELDERVKSVKDFDTAIFERLMFSYDRLKDSNMQNCFLYCSLYPEDYEIRKVELIESWMDEGFLGGSGTRKAMYNRGHSILNRLENNFLLERTTNFLGEEVTKMHDVLRDMAFYIKREGPRIFMGKAGLQLKKLPAKHEWTADLEKVSLMENSIEEIPPHMSPECPYLSTLLLQGNHGLRSIPESFFKHMPGLKVLNLSHTGITTLPHSISNLENLNALVLVHCRSLSSLPSLANLRALRKLDLYYTNIEEVPHGIDMLENLTYLRLRSSRLKDLGVRISPKIHDHLQYLDLGYIMA